MWFLSRDYGLCTRSGGYLSTNVVGICAYMCVPNCTHLRMPEQLTTFCDLIVENFNRALSIHFNCGQNNIQIMETLNLDMRIFTHL